MMIIVGCESSKGETWVHYISEPEYRELARYPSIEECRKAETEASAPSGCKRVDGPYKILNDIADIAFGH